MLGDMGIGGNVKRGCGWCLCDECGRVVNSSGQVQTMAEFQSARVSYHLTWMGNCQTY